MSGFELAKLSVVVRQQSNNPTIRESAITRRIFRINRTASFAMIFSFVKVSTIGWMTGGETIGNVSFGNMDFLLSYEGLSPFPDSAPDGY